MKKTFLSLALLALVAVGMLSISSCKKEEELQGTFVYYNEPFEKHLKNLIKRLRDILNTQIQNFLLLLRAIFLLSLNREILW